MTTKLQIIGPYTPEHEGPFCTRDRRPARIICANRKSGATPERSVVALVDDGDWEIIIAFEEDGRNCTWGANFDLMNAREVPVAREFWVNEYHDGFGSLRPTEQAAKCTATKGFIRTIHVREVLPGEGE